MRRLLVPLMVALAGIVSLVLLFPRFDPATSLRAVLGRDQAIAKTRQLASANGVNTAGWQAIAAEVLDAPTGPVRIEVALVAPGTRRTLEAGWSPNGRLEWSNQPGGPQRAVHSTIVVPADRRKVQVNVDEGKSRDRLSYQAVRAVEGLWLVTSVIYFVVEALRRRLRYRVAAILSVVLIAGVAAGFWGGTSYQRTQVVRLDLNAAHNSSSGDIDINVGGSGRQTESSRGGAIFWLFLWTAAGISLRGIDNQRKWYPVELLARRMIFSRPVGWSVAAGLMSGIGIAAIPYWIAASGLFRGSVLVFRSVETLAAPFPASVAWDLSAAVLAVGVFGFAFPRVKLRRPVFRWGLFGLIGIAAIDRTITPFSTPGANLFTGVVLFGVYLLLYLKTDLLATMTAMVAAQAALSPCLLLVQPGGSVRALALPLLSIWAVALGASCRFAVRGSEGEDLPVTSAPESAEERTTKTGRRRLEAEFEVARKAQQDALPAVAPTVAGYTIAGSCEPAQQVGGDLYDYFSLADGRLGIAVADVSGKGVPAALYMMVTKGLLAATTRESSDLSYILQQVNRHLYTTCKKKVFVTLAAVALDPVAHRLQHGRAGHNPILWRRAGRRETVVLKPPGVGLGMTPGERFNRALKIEELQLEAGDAIVLYSDGVTEAMDAGLEQFGEERLIRAVESADGKPAEESRAAILCDLAAFTNGAPARDDVTLVVLRVAGNGVLT